MRIVNRIAFLLLCLSLNLLSLKLGAQVTNSNTASPTYEEFLNNWGNYIPGRPNINPNRELHLMTIESTPRPRGLMDGRTLQPASLSQWAQKLPLGSILVIGELHDKTKISNQHVEVLNELRRAGKRLTVGMEFYSYPHQNLLNDFRSGSLSEIDFLSRISWGKMSFDNYRRETLFPDIRLGEVTLALNAPRALTGRIAKVGLSGLTSDEKALLPPQLELGNKDYRTRFSELMGGHVPADKIALYFEAQSTWDETMAWQALKATPADSILVIIVGEFHVAYGGGLPDRLKARMNREGQNWSRPVFTLVQIDAEEKSEQDIEDAISPNGPYGPRGDLIWLE